MRKCADCGCPMLPKGQVKKDNEYDHARGCPQIMTDHKKDVLKVINTHALSIYKDRVTPSAAYKDSEPTDLVSMSTTTDRAGLPQVQVGLTQFTQSNARKVANEILSLLSEDWDELRDRTNSALAFGPSRDK